MKFQYPQNPNFVFTNPNRNNLKSRNCYRGGGRRNDVSGIGFIYDDFPKPNHESWRRFPHRKKKSGGGDRLFAPYAPRNTTSFIIRSKKCGGIASLVSPYPVTPAVLPTPMFSPAREVLVDSVEEEWGVDGYGSMSGLIRLRSPGNEAAAEEDHDFSRFEMIFPSSAAGGGGVGVGVGGSDDWAVDSHLVSLKEENLTLKEKVFLLESELEDLRWRIDCLERHNNGGGGGVSENASENDGRSGGGCGGEVSSGRSLAMVTG